MCVCVRMHVCALVCTFVLGFSIYLMYKHIMHIHKAAMEIYIYIYIYICMCVFITYMCNTQSPVCQYLSYHIQFIQQTLN